MNRIHTTCLLALCGSSLAQAQTFEKSIQGANAQFGTAISATSDGGFILAGYTMAFGVGSGFYDNVYLVRTDADGDTLWTRTYGGALTDQGFAVEQTGDGGFLVAGTSNSFGTSGKDVYLIRTDSNGDLQWSKTYGGPGEDVGYGLALTPDGGAIVVGQSGSSGGPGGGLNAYVIRVDAVGDTLWTRTYDSVSDNYAYSVNEVAGGGHIIAGVGAVSLWCMELLRIDDTGAVIWNKDFCPGYADGRDAVQTSDGGFIVTGQFGSDACLVKTDVNGDTLWVKTYGGPQVDYGYSVVQTTDGGYALSGEQFSKTWLARMEANGDTLWQHTYSGGSAEVNQVVANADGGFAVCGNRFGGPGSGGYAMQLVRTGTDGYIACNIENPVVTVSAASFSTYSPTLTISTYGEVNTPATLVSAGAIMVTPCSTVGVAEAALVGPNRVFPNPAADLINILDEDGGMIALSQMQLIDATGRLWPIQAGAGGRSLDVSDLAEGAYQVRFIDTDGSVRFARFMKIR